MAVINYIPSRCVPPRGDKVATSYSSLGFSVELLPGHNSKLSTEEIKKLQEHPDFQRDLKIGGVVILGDAETATSQKSGETLADLSEFNVKEAEEVIEAETDVATLKQWLAAEDRVTVERDLNRRIATLERGD